MTALFFRLGHKKLVVQVDSRIGIKWIFFIQNSCFYWMRHG